MIVKNVGFNRSSPFKTMLKQQWYMTITITMMLVSNECSWTFALEFFLPSGDTVESMLHLHLNVMIDHPGQNGVEQQILSRLKVILVVSMMAPCHIASSTWCEWLWGCSLAPTTSIEVDCASKCKVSSRCGWQKQPVSLVHTLRWSYRWNPYTCRSESRGARRM